MTNREWALTLYEELTYHLHRPDEVAAIERAIGEILDAAAERALALMTKLNTDYRHEIVDAIRGAK